MHTPVLNPHKRAPHPLLIIAALAVILFCGVGTAAIMGWLPASNGGDAKNAAPAGLARGAAVAPAPYAAPPAPDGATPEATPLTPLTPPNRAPAGAAQPARADAPPAPVAPAAPVCANCGVVASVRAVTHRGDSSGAGIAGGAVLGGLLGNQVGNGNGRSLATIAGAVGGAVAGNQIERNIKTTLSYNITVRLDNGKQRTLHQSTQPEWQPGDRVRIVDGALRSNL